MQNMRNFQGRPPFKKQTVNISNNEESEIMYTRSFHLVLLQTFSDYTLPGRKKTQITTINNNIINNNNNDDDNRGGTSCEYCW